MDKPAPPQAAFKTRASRRAEHKAEIAQLLDEAKQIVAETGTSQRRTAILRDEIGVLLAELEGR